MGGRAWRGVWHCDIQILHNKNPAGTVPVSHIQHQGPVSWSVLKTL